MEVTEQLLLFISETWCPGFTAQTRVSAWPDWFENNTALEQRRPQALSMTPLSWSYTARWRSRNSIPHDSILDKLLPTSWQLHAGGEKNNNKKKEIFPLICIFSALMDAVKTKSTWNPRSERKHSSTDGRQKHTWNHGKFQNV